MMLCNKQSYLFTNKILVFHHHQLQGAVQKAHFGLIFSPPLSELSNTPFPRKLFIQRLHRNSSVIHLIQMSVPLASAFGDFFFHLNNFSQISSFFSSLVKCTQHPRIEICFPLLQVSFVLLLKSHSQNHTKRELL